VTKASGRQRGVSFRWACNKRLRQALTTYPTTAATPAPGPRTSTTAHAPPAKTTPTPPASSPEPGSASCGAAGRTTRPTTRLCTAAPSTPLSPRRLRPDFDLEVDTRCHSHPLSIVLTNGNVNDYIPFTQAMVGIRFRAIEDRPGQPAAQRVRQAEACHQERLKVLAHPGQLEMVAWTPRLRSGAVSPARDRVPHPCSLKVPLVLVRWRAWRIGARPSACAPPGLRPVSNRG
jgi:hypothetical protein